MQSDTPRRPWDTLSETIASGDAQRLLAFLATLGPAETACTISRLPAADQQRLLTLLDPADAAGVIGDVPGTQAADLIEVLPPGQAAAIIDEMPSDRQADLLGGLAAENAEAILQEMSPDEAEDVRQLLAHPADTAGGIMITEHLAYRQDLRVSDVLADLQARRDTYADYHVQYLYVTDDRGTLTGVLRVHDLLFASRTAPLSAVMLPNPLFVRTDTGLQELRQFFDQHKLLGVPVVDAARRLVGVVLAEAVEEAGRRQADRQFLSFSGIIGGEEFRSMPLVVRSGRRLTWLSINIGLNIVAASVISVYQDTLAAAIALAIFLPMISDMSGCSGNQAVAVSLRELALGLVRPHEVLRVLGKEVGLGAINGAVLGLLLAGVAILWKGNPWLGLVVGGALVANTVVAVTLGGTLPLLLRRLGLDPALVSGPILTTVTDMCGFFLVLSIATSLLPRLAH